jgi:hypothetical protein
MDIANLLETKLKQEICSIYTPSDMATDVRAFRVAMGLPPHSNTVTKTKGRQAPNTNPQSSYIFSDVVKKLAVNKLNWERLLTMVNHVGKTKSALVRLDAEGVRRAVLAEYNGDVASWLAAAVGQGFPNWLARQWLPLPHTQAPPVEFMRDMWNVLSKFQDSPTLRSIVAQRLPLYKDKSDFTLFKEGFKRVCALVTSPIIVYDLVADALWVSGKCYKDHPLANVLRDRPRIEMNYTQCMDVLERARQIGSMGRDVDSLELAHTCVDYVFDNHLDYSDIETQLINARHARLLQRVQQLHTYVYIDTAVYTDDTDLDNAVTYYEKEKIMVDWFKQYNLHIEDFDSEVDFVDEEGQPIPSRVQDLTLGLWTDVLKPMYDVYGILKAGQYHISNPWGEWEPAVLSTRFARYEELKDALHALNLVLRNDSRVCAEYVIDGTYSGPGTCQDKRIDGYVALEQVVAMMGEMNFLFTHTKYSDFMRNTRDSEQAKVLAVRAYLNKDKDLKAETRLKDVPLRLADIVKKQGMHPLTEEEQELQEFYCPYWSDDDSDDTYDSDDTDI